MTPRVQVFSLVQVTFPSYFDHHEESHRYLHLHKPMVRYNPPKVVSYLDQQPVGDVIKFWRMEVIEN